MPRPDPAEAGKRSERTSQSPGGAAANAPAPKIEFELVKRAIKAVLDAPSASITLVDAREAPVGVSFVMSAVHGDKGFFVEDTTQDERFGGNPYVMGEPRVVFYAAVPLITSGGTHLGSLCIIDDEPHEASANARAVLSDMAQIVVNQFELHQRVRQRHVRLDDTRPKPDNQKSAGEQTAGTKETGRPPASAVPANSGGTVQQTATQEGHSPPPQEHFNAADAASDDHEAPDDNLPPGWQGEAPTLNEESWPDDVFEQWKNKLNE